MHNIITTTNKMEYWDIRTVKQNSETDIYKIEIYVKVGNVNKPEIYNVNDARYNLLDFTSGCPKYGDNFIQSEYAEQALKLPARVKVKVLNNTLLCLINGYNGN